MILYVLRDGDAYKIGVTGGSASKRKSQLQTGNPNEIEIVYEFRARDAYGVERELHQRLAAYDIPGGGDEWFRFRTLDPLHAELNRMIRQRRIIETKRYDVNFVRLLASRLASKLWVPVLILLGTGLACSIWSGMIF